MKRIDKIFGAATLVIVVLASNIIAQSPRPRPFVGPVRPAPRTTQPLYGGSNSVIRSPTTDERIQYRYHDLLRQYRPTQVLDQHNLYQQARRDVLGNSYTPPSAGVRAAAGIVRGFNFINQFEGLSGRSQTRNVGVPNQTRMQPLPRR